MISLKKKILHCTIESVSVALFGTVSNVPGVQECNLHSVVHDISLFVKSFGLEGV